MLASIVQRLFWKPSIPLFYVETEHEYEGKHSALDLLDDQWLLQHLMMYKRSQNRVLFPHFGILTPVTVCASNYKGEFFPFFFKDVDQTKYIDDKTKIQDLLSLEYVSNCIIQEC